MRCQIWLKQSTVTNPAVCHDKVVNQQLLLAQARPMMMNHLTSFLSDEVANVLAATLAGW